MTCRHLVFASLVSSLALLGACDDDPSAGSDAGPIDGSTGSTPNVTPADGGTITSDDGLAVLVVPPDAVSEPVFISITRVTEVPAAIAGETVGRMYDLAPDGLAFAVPARLTVTLAPEDVAALDFTMPIQSRGLSTLSHEGTLERLRNGRMEVDFDEPGVVVSGDLEHFSCAFTSLRSIYVNLAPGNVRTGVPARWDSTLTIGQVGVTYRYDIDEWAALGLPNPPGYRVLRRECEADGVVEVDTCPAVPVTSHEPREVTTVEQSFDCIPMGRGRYRACVLIDELFEDSNFESCGHGVALCEGVNEAGFAPGARAALRRSEYSFLPREELDLATLLGLSAPEPTLVVIGNGVMIAKRNGDILQAIEDTMSPPGTNDLFDGEVVRWMGDTGPQVSLLTVGAGGFFNRNFNPATQEFGLFQQVGFGNVMTAAHAVWDEASDITTSVIVVDNTVGEALSLVYGEFGLVEVEPTPVLSAAEISGASIPGRLVDFVLTGDGSSYVATTDEQIFFGTLGGAITMLGSADASAGFRTLGCSDVACGVASFGASQVSSFRLDPMGVPLIATLETHPVSEPVRVHAQGDFLAVAGGGDDTVHMIARPAASASYQCTGSLVGMCANPSSATIVPGPTSSTGVPLRVSVTCADDATYLITDDAVFLDCAP